MYSTVDTGYSNIAYSNKSDIVIFFRGPDFFPIPYVDYYSAYSNIGYSNKSLIVIRSAGPLSMVNV